MIVYCLNCWIFNQISQIFCHLITITFQPEEAFLKVVIRAPASALILVLIIVFFESIFGFPSDAAINPPILQSKFCLYSLTWSFYATQ